MASDDRDVARVPLAQAPPHPALPESTHVGGVRLQVADIQRSLGYYTDVIGLRILDVSGDAAALGVLESDRPLVSLRSVSGTRPAHRRGTFGLFHFAILVPDRASLGRFVAHLASKDVRPGMSDHKVSEAIYLSDPDGLGIEVYADRPRREWQYVNRQLVMSTDPLNVGDLVAAGAGAPWRGMPAGTTMGHVHLHVGDLNVAAAFYHRALGLDLTVWNYPGALFFSAGGYHHHLGTNTWAPGPAPTADQARLLEWTLVLPTADDARIVGGRLAAAGYDVAGEGQDWTVADPWTTPLRISPRMSNVR